MAGLRPTDSPAWATDENQVAPPNNPTKVEPPTGLKDEGWLPGLQPPAEMHNWWMNLVGKWIEHLQDIAALNNWKTEVATVASHVAQGVIAGLNNESLTNPMWVVFGSNGGSPQLVVSETGDAWATQTFPAGPATAFTAGIRLLTASVRYLVGSTNGRIIRATNLTGGGNWALVTSNLEGVGVVSGFAFDDVGGVVVAFSDQTGANSFVRSTDDGATWSAVITSGLANAIVDCVWHPESSEFIAVSSTGEIISSSDGLVWATKGVGVGVSALTRGLASGRGLLVAQRTVSGSTTTHVSSDDGVTWVNFPTEDGGGTFIAQDKEELIFVEDLGLFCLSGGARQFFTTANGQVWERHIVDVSDSEASVGFDGIAFGQKTLMMVGEDIAVQMQRIGGSYE